MAGSTGILSGVRMDFFSLSAHPWTAIAIAGAAAEPALVVVDETTLRVRRAYAGPTRPSAPVRVGVTGHELLPLGLPGRKLAAGL